MRTYRPGGALAALLALTASMVVVVSAFTNSHTDLLPDLGAPPPPPPPPSLLSAPSLAALALAFTICILASSAGIGGGAALVPVYLTLARQGPAAAVALSNTTILGAALAAFALNVTRVHTPSDGPPRPLIDWSIILLMEPATIVGAVGGALLNAVTPPWATLAGLSLLLTFITHNVAARAWRTWVAESVALGRGQEEAVAAEDGSEAGGSGADLRAGLLLVEGGESDDEGRPKPAPGAAASPPASPKPPVLAGLPLPEAEVEVGPAPATAPLPLNSIAALVALFAAVAASDAAKRTFRCGSLPYWSATLAVVPPAATLTLWARSRLLADVAAAHHHLAWTRLNTAAIPAVSLLAGAAAGMFGVGGGIVKVPILLIAGLPPEAAAATCQTMIMFTSATASLVYASAGAAPRAWTAAVAGVGLAGAVVGVAGLARAIDASGGRRSLVVISMAATLGASLIAASVQAIEAALAAWKAGEMGRRGSVC